MRQDDNGKLGPLITSTEAASVDERTAPAPVMHRSCFARRAAFRPDPLSAVGMC